MHITQNLRKYDVYMTNKKKKLIESATITTPIIFDSAMRKMFVKGVLQDIKGYFENITNGKVAITYEDFNLKNHEFGFKLFVKKLCTKQIWSETTSAIVNVVNYMFPYDGVDDNGDNSFDVTICMENDILEVEIVSNW